MRWIFLCLFLCGCTSDTSSGSGGTAEATGGAGSGTGGSGAEAASGGAEGGDDAPPPPPDIDCDTVSDGSTCTPDLEGETCGTGDDCGGTTYRCDGGVWLVDSQSGCNAPIIECGDEPVAGDGCPHFSRRVCDPGDDCIDVLICDQFNWRTVEECPADLCADAGPVAPGADCVVEQSWLGCPGQGTCENVIFECSTVWRAIGADVPEECNPESL